MPESRAKLAIPFVGLDTPSAASEFAHPDVVIGLTILAYRYEQLRMSDTHALLAHLHESLQREPGHQGATEANISSPSADAQVQAGPPMPEAASAAKD